MNPDEVHLWHENYYYCLMKLTERRPRVCSTINKSKHCYFQKLYLSNWEYALYNIYALQISYYYWLIDLFSGWSIILYCNWMMRKWPKWWPKYKFPRELTISSSSENREAWMSECFWIQPLSHMEKSDCKSSAENKQHIRNPFKKIISVFTSEHSWFWLWSLIGTVPACQDFLTHFVYWLLACSNSSFTIVHTVCFKV